MRILVDADACPVKDLILEEAISNNIELHMFFDDSHIYSDDYSIIHIVDTAFDSVDFALVNKTLKNDVVVTQDYGLATLVLAKGAYAISQNGMIYDDGNIIDLLSRRHNSAKMRKSGKRCKGPKKRSRENDIEFSFQFSKLIKKVINL